MENCFESKEFQELMEKFTSGLQEDVKNWDSFWNLLYFVHDYGRKEG